ncbi:MAG: stage II sporulation protein P [Cellulosilyticaceae bacterium]
MKKNTNLLGKKYINSQFFCKVLVVWLFVWSFMGTFKYINRMYDDAAPEVFLSRCIPGYFPRISDRTFQEAYIYYTTNITLQKPITFFYNTIPYFKTANKTLNLYEDEIDGYFRIAEEETLLDLKEGNVYTPQLPTPKKFDVNLNKLEDYRYVKQYFVMGDSAQEGLGMEKDLLNQWNFKDLAKKQLGFKQTSDGPKVLIFHTHVKERYCDEGAWDEGDGVAAVGEKLADTLEKQYGIKTLHITDSVYQGDDSENVTGAYERIETIVKKVLKDNPSIEMCIDVHRDGVNTRDKFLANVNGKATAQAMFVTGVCQMRNQKGELKSMKNLLNPYIPDNIAFALQAKIVGNEYYPGFLRKIYFKPYRYSLHMKPMSLLLEVGNQNNTKAEAMNVAEPMAHIIAKVLEKD